MAVLNSLGGYVKSGLENKRVRGAVAHGAMRLGQPSIRGLMGHAPVRTASQLRNRGYRRAGVIGGALAMNRGMTRFNQRTGYNNSSGSRGYAMPRSSGGFA